MSRLYGTIKGAARSKATRRGHKHLVTHAAGWKGAIRVEVNALENGQDVYTVYLTPWQNSGGSTRELCSGVLNAAQVQS